MAIVRQERTRSAPCACGCGARHLRILGKVSWPESDNWHYYFAMLAHEGATRHVWLTFGGGPRIDDRDGFISVMAWREGNQFVSRITDGRESPFREHEIFVDGDARILDRDEVFPSALLKTWVFETVNALLVGDRSVNAFLLD